MPHRDKLAITWQAGLLLLLFLACSRQPDKQAQQAGWKPVSYEGAVGQKIDSLLAIMTIEEKLGQLYQASTAGSNRIDSATTRAIRAGRVGSMLINRRNFFTLEERNYYQKIAVEQSRLGIPLLFGHDVIHGFETIFPTSLAQSCTWWPRLVEQAAAAAAREATARGVDLAFSPMVDVSRDPRWGRIGESYGEDPWLNAVFGRAVIRGYQGDNPAAPDKLAACLKHYVGYAAGTGGRGKQFTDISLRTLHEVYLPPFKAGIEEGALAVMTAFNDLNGVPATANAYVLRKILKSKYNFNGMVLSDWNAVAHLLVHGLARDSLEAAVMALKAGTDMEMRSNLYSLLPTAFEQGTLSIQLLDDAVRRVLYVKFRLGLFDRPYSSPHTPADTRSQHRQLARQLAAASMVLLQNRNQVLPLKEKLSVAVVGPFAHETEIMGWWKSLGKNDEVITAYHGLLTNAPHQTEITDHVTASTDVIVACLGEAYATFGESRSKADIRLDRQQIALLQKLQKYDKPVVAVIFNGRPLDLSEVLPLAAGIVLAWHPGTEAGNALADVLYGRQSPGGRLTTTFPRSVAQVPLYYNHRNSGSPASNKYVDLTGEPLFPFGYGLSYTSFSYDSLITGKTTLSARDTLYLQISLTNTGRKTGTEIVQLYIRDLVGSTTRPVRELKDFARVTIPPGTTTRVTFKLPVSRLAVLNEAFEPVVEPGEFEFRIAPDAATPGLSGKFMVVN